MHNVDPNFLNAILQNEVKLAELFEITLTNGKTYYYTTHDQDLIWGPNAIRYQSIPLERDDTTHQLNLQADSIKLKLANMSVELAAMLHTNVLDGASLILKRILWNEQYKAGMELIVFQGFADIAFDRNILSMECTSILDSLNIVVPRNLYQEPCSYSLFSPACGVDKNKISPPWKFSSLTSEDSPDEFTLVDISLNPPDEQYYELGEVVITSGENIGQHRMVRLYNASDHKCLFSCALPFPLLANTSYDIYPGCDKCPETCRDKFNNLINFSGFVYIPKAEDVIF